MYILYMYNVHVLHVISPVEVIYMNYEIYESTPFDRQSTVNKQIKRWCKRTRQKCRGQGGMYMGVFTSKCLIFSSSVTLSPSVLIYIHLTIPEQFAAIFLFDLSLNHQSPAPYTDVVPLVCLHIKMTARDPLPSKPWLVGESFGQVNRQLLTVVAKWRFI